MQRRDHTEENRKGRDVIRVKEIYGTVQERKENDEHRDRKETDPIPVILGMGYPQGEDESYNIWLWKPEEPRFLGSYNQYGLTPKA